MKTISKIVLAGGTGQLGKALVNFSKDQAQEIIVLSRRLAAPQGNVTTLVWDGASQGAWSNALENADMLVNLTGKNVNCRYTESNKREIIASRVNSVHALAAAIQNLKNPPKLWVQLASATIYRHAEDRPMTENNGELGNGFSEQVCKQWENTLTEQTPNCKNIRTAILRTSLVLSKHDGVYPRLKKMTQFGLGGRQGTGRQWVSWVHEDDVVCMIEWLRQNPNENGIYNCTAANPLQNSVFMEIFRNNLGVRFGLPAPKWLLELGALLIGTETELILKSRWVLPERALQAGYQFRYATLEAAMSGLKT